MAMMPTVASLERLSAASLSKLLLAEQVAAEGDSTIAVIDVRDHDHIGGHIKGSRHVPSQKLDAMMPALVRQLQDKRTVVFHCALSQQRGPGAALRYLRERERMLAGGAAAEAAEGLGENGSTAQPREQQQQVFVLDGGFVGWQAEYGDDERLTEGYRKELWKDGFFD